MIKDFRRSRFESFDANVVDARAFSGFGFLDEFGYFKWVCWVDFIRWINCLEESAYCGIYVNCVLGKTGAWGVRGELFFEGVGEEFCLVFCLEDQSVGAF